ncbi:MAG TPA: protein translocase subunit SecF [Ilumatobacteraceae bacterium]|nr:protein translocase subunit SecF [Ilumatobacteraceae bacterium]HRB04805.1 protein translocase subunit SecF [Ilumatobacteraceae bacterium]
MTDIDNDIITSSSHNDPNLTAMGTQRRSPWGRLYHGETAIDFYGRRWIGLGFSIVVLLLSVGSIATKGLNLSLDFKGGVVWTVPSETLSEDAARAVLDDQGLDGSNAIVRSFVNNGDGLRTLEVQVGEQTDQVRRTVQQAFADEVGVDTESVSTTSVSSTWGKSITEKALRALIVFLVLVAVFISWRMEWRMAFASIAAVLHDVLLSVGIYSLFGFSITPATVVAFLTILGFSLYDTIVVFDKVLENQKRYSTAKLPYADVINVSMNQVLMRSLNTSIAAVLPVLSLLVLGSGILGAVTLREFALALLVGLITGSYSSIFIASPLVAILKEREPRYVAMRGQHATGAELERLVHGGTPGGRREQRRVAHGDSTAVVGAPISAEALLTHAPRPRKKKRRV